MKVINSKPTSLSWVSPPDKWVSMGVIRDSGKEYACILDVYDKQLYIEEIHWSVGEKNLVTARLAQIDNDKEWVALYKFITEKTDIFSPKKVKKMTGRSLYVKRTSKGKQNEKKG